MTSEPILEVENLVTQFRTEEGVVKAVDGNSFTLYKGEVLGIVGESGSGKSVTAMSIMRLIDEPGYIKEGTVRYKGEDLLTKSKAEMREIRGNDIAMMFQDPMTSLNPVYTIGSQISRVIRKHTDATKATARERTIELLSDVGIPEPATRVDDYPHQFSGGMRQRVLLAMAISCDPEILIADEPTTALDVTIEAQIFDLIDRLQEKYRMSVILITHDLGVVAGSCDRVAVVYAGRIVERAGVHDLFNSPRHPYTRGLMRSIPNLRSNESRLTPIEGRIPDLTALPTGCSFHPRCIHATEECSQTDPDLREVEAGREAACIHALGYNQATMTQNTNNSASTEGGVSND
ncbi:MULTISPECIES: ABC transporter ATP-binding protein [unclassified Haladaptatus]|uniref:ABC transporter ATP-binding protein n=2 Tax=Haladaptatus TaxID=367188 RepID=UPI0023E76A15|nr:MULTISPECIES: ABC transporter ATP-binding protein [unclassified Haladaptatus]